MSKDTEILLATTLEELRHELDILERVVGEMSNNIDALMADMDAVQKYIKVRTE